MRRIPKADRAGLYVTVIVHLAVLIILLVVQLGRQLRSETSFVLDFSKLEEIERLQQELEFKQEVNRQLEEMLAEQGVGTTLIRNIAVNRGELRDDRNTDAAQLYADAERLQQELSGGFSAPNEDVADPGPDPAGTKDPDPPAENHYSGPSVLSYELTGRRASHLPIPAYRCYGEGKVKVNITVDNAGTVVLAKVDESESAADNCLRSFAIRAARLSKFSSDPGAPARQTGYILYQFIAQ